VLASPPRFRHLLWGGAGVDVVRVWVQAPPPQVNRPTRSGGSRFSSQTVRGVPAPSYATQGCVPCPCPGATPSPHPLSPNACAHGEAALLLVVVGG